MLMEEEYKVKYANTFFCTYGKWGYQLTPTEAQELGLIKNAKPAERTKRVTRTRAKTNGGDSK